MTLDLITGQFAGLPCAALLDGKRLFDLAVDAPAGDPLYQSVWRATVDRILPKVGAFRSGDTLVVQVKSVRGEDKAHIVTRDIALPGRLFVYLPLSPGLKTPRHGGRPGDPDTLLQALTDAGIEGGIVRTGAARAGQDSLVAEAAGLRQRWLALSALPQEGLLLPGPDAQARLMLDYAEQEVAPSSREYDPELLAPLTRPAVDLGQGASLILERTSALTAIDVNSGQRPPADVNMVAAGEAARQIRLRNLSGLIVIDFAAPGPKPGSALFKAMERALLPDPAKPRIMGMTPAGLLEITRPRRTLPLEEILKLAQDRA
jgi:Ribonuclease G/E